MICMRPRSKGSLRSKQGVGAVALGWANVSTSGICMKMRRLGISSLGVVSSTSVVCILRLC